MNYEDIITLEHHTSKVHPRMPLRDRAAQFAPFAALTGFDAVIEAAEKKHLAGHTDEPDTESPSE